MRQWEIQRWLFEIKEEMDNDYVNELVPLQLCHVVSESGCRENF